MRLYIGYWRLCLRYYLPALLLSADIRIDRDLLPSTIRRENVEEKRLRPATRQGSTTRRPKFDGDTGWRVSARPSPVLWGSTSLFWDRKARPLWGHYIHDRYANRQHAGRDRVWGTVQQPWRFAVYGKQLQHRRRTDLPRFQLWCVLIIKTLVYWRYF